MNKSTRSRRQIPGWIKWTVLGLLILLLWTALGAMVLGGENQNVSGRIGDVGTAIDRANGLLGRLETQLAYTNDAQQKAITEITNARSAIFAADRSSDSQQVLNAAKKTQFALAAVSEAYPSFGLPQVEKGLLEETAGSYNRIAYAQHQLIQAQQGFNTWRIVYLPDMLIFPAKQIFNSDENSHQQLNPSRLNGGSS